MTVQLHKRQELIDQGYTIFQQVAPPLLVERLAAAVDARVLSMEHYVRPDGLNQTRHKGDHLHLTFNRKVRKCTEAPHNAAMMSFIDVSQKVFNIRGVYAADPTYCTAMTRCWTNRWEAREFVIQPWQSWCRCPRR